MKILSISNSSGQLYVLSNSSRNVFIAHFRSSDVPTSIDIWWHDLQ